MQRLKIQYPSLRSVKSQTLPHGHAGIVTLSMRGVKSHTGASKITYDLIVDFRGFPSQIPEAYVRHPSDADIMHVNVFDGSRTEFAPNTVICWICLGGNYPDVYRRYPKDRLFRMGAYITQLQYALSNPNPMDCARHV